MYLDLLICASVALFCYLYSVIQKKQDSRKIILPWKCVFFATLIVVLKQLFKATVEAQVFVVYDENTLRLIQKLGRLECGTV
jgi:hypothetical protein